MVLVTFCMPREGVVVAEAVAVAVEEAVAEEEEEGVEREEREGEVEWVPAPPEGVGKEEGVGSGEAGGDLLEPGESDGAKGVGVREGVVKGVPVPPTALGDPPSLVIVGKGLGITVTREEVEGVVVPSPKVRLPRGV